MSEVIDNPEIVGSTARVLRQSIVDTQQLVAGFGQAATELIATWKSPAASNLNAQLSFLARVTTDCWHRLAQAATSIEHYCRCLFAAHRILAGVVSPSGESSAFAQVTGIVSEVQAAARWCAAELRKASPDTVNWPRALLTNNRDQDPFGRTSVSADQQSPGLSVLGKQAASQSMLAFPIFNMGPEFFDQLTRLFQQYGSQGEFVYSYLTSLGPNITAVIAWIPDTPAGNRFRIALGNSIVAAGNAGYLPPRIQKILSGPGNSDVPLSKMRGQVQDYAALASIIGQATQQISPNWLASLTRSSLAWQKEAINVAGLETVPALFLLGPEEKQRWDEAAVQSIEATQKLLTLAAAQPVIARELLGDPETRQSIVYTGWLDDGQAAASVINAVASRQGIDGSKNAPIVQGIFDSVPRIDPEHIPIQLVRRSLLQLTFQYLDAFSGIPPAETKPADSTDIPVVSLDFDARREWLRFIQNDTEDSLALTGFSQAVAKHVLDSAAQNPAFLPTVAWEVGGLQAAVFQGRVDALEQSLNNQYTTAVAAVKAHNEELVAKQKGVHVFSELLGIETSIVGAISPSFGLGLGIVSTFSQDVLSTAIDHIYGQPLDIPAPDYSAVIDEQREGSQANFDRNFAIDLAEAICQAHQLNRFALTKEEISAIHPILADLEKGNLSNPSWQQQHPNEVSQTLQWLQFVAGRHGEIAEALNAYHRSASDALQIK